MRDGDWREDCGQSPIPQRCLLFRCSDHLPAEAEDGLNGFLGASMSDVSLYWVIALSIDGIWIDSLCNIW